MISNTKYHIASSPGHYQAVHRLMREEGIERHLVGFPTVLAWDKDELIGFCGTRIQDSMILAGPLVVRTDRRRLFTIMRLCEAYEAAMASMEIETFILQVEDGSLLHRGMKRYYPDMQPYAMDGQGNAFYTWRTPYGRRQGQRSSSYSGGESPTEESSGVISSPTPDN